MALKLLQPGTNPIGHFDCLDTDLLTIKGGEVMTFGSTAVPPGDKGASDSFDGYVTNTGAKRAVVRLAGPVSNDGYLRPLMLSDEGIAGYGTLFGSVVGGTVGQVATGGAVLGPHTATGSGKVTCWDKPGLYAVSLDAVDGGDGSNPTTALQPTNTTLDVTFAQGALTFTSAGLLCTVASGRGVAGASSAAVVGHFVDFESNGSLVNTPNRLVAALNSPSGNVSSLALRKLAYVTFYFNPPTA